MTWIAWVTDHGTVKVSVRTANTDNEMERLKSNYDQLQHSSSAERFDMQDKIYRLRNELQDSKDQMAAEQIVLG